MKEPSGIARLYGKAFASTYWQKWSHGRVDHFMSSGEDDYLHGNETVTKKYQYAQKVFLEGDYEYFAAIEYDMICPTDALERLRELDTDIAYGLYVFRHIGKRYWNVANRLELLGAAWMSQDLEMARKAWGNVARVQGCGLGITLIKRSVLESCKFRSWKGVSCDWGLAYDARGEGFEQACDTRIVCGHMTMTPSPQILWPDPNEESLVRQEFLE
jgi:hypothetical protein